MNMHLLTTVVHGHKAKYRRPHLDKDLAWPAIGVGWQTSRDCNDPISAGLNDVMNSHAVDGPSKAVQEFDYSLPSTLRFAWAQNGPIGIQNTSQASHDTCQGANDAKADCNHELDFDVAKTEALPPSDYVVRGPDEGVDEVHEV
jgi:hypothetical protein